MTRILLRAPALAAALGALAAAAPGAAADPIASGPPTSLPAFQGAAAEPEPVGATRPPQNPLMARDPFSNIHNDAWMTDAYRYRGPLGRSPEAVSEAKPAAVCGSLTFDRRGRIVTVCPSLLAAPQARVIDPVTLRTLATYDLPNAPTPPGVPGFQNFAGGGYFFLDRRDRIWVATRTNHLFVLAQRDGGTRLAKVDDYPLTSVLDDDERVTSALPDWRGRIWLVSRSNGKVAVLDRRTRRIRVLRLGEQVQNSFAVDRDAIYVVSERRMYRLRATRRGAPRIAWRVRYRNSGLVKPGQADAGSGTTPTIMRGGYVAITDNADPMNVVVYRKALRLRRGQRRVVCQVPVFRRGASATENSLMTAGRSLVVENNYGYQDPFGPQAGALTEPGFARVDVNRRGTGCRKVWETFAERAPSVVPKLSARAGLVYTYTRPEDPSGSLPWYWTAISLRTGKTVFKQLAGSGAAFNNNYAGIAIAPDGTAYLGVIGGIVALRDRG
jgi:hypothetical protein